MKSPTKTVLLCLEFDEVSLISKPPQLFYNRFHKIPSNRPSQINDEKVSQTQISKISGISAVTIRDRVKETKKKSEGKSMGRTCSGICVMHKAEPGPNKIRYEIGQKRCTFCEIFLSSEESRGICCKAVLRTTPRSKKKI